MNRLKSLREEKGMKQSELGKLLNVKDAAISKYESGKVPLTGDTLLQLSKIFDVPIDYILGNEKYSVDYANHQSEYSLSDEKEINSVEQKYFYFFFDDKSLLRDTFIKRLTSAMADEGMSENDFICSAPIGSERASAILKGELDPSANDLIELARFLNTSIDYLLGQIPALSFSEKKLLNTFVKLSEDNKDILIGKSKELLQNQRYEESVAAESPLREAK
jgi:transcriptional regulator with XRE-family HTH domain